jgi:hypothetical protein
MWNEAAQLAGDEKGTGVDGTVSGGQVRGSESDKGAATCQPSIGHYMHMCILGLRKVV